MASALGGARAVVYLADGQRTPAEGEVGEVLTRKGTEIERLKRLLEGRAVCRPTCTPGKAMGACS